MLKRLYQKCIYQGAYVIIILLAIFIIFNHSVLRKDQKLSSNYFQKASLSNPNLLLSSNQNKDSMKRESETYDLLLNKFHGWFERNDFNDHGKESVVNRSVDIEVKPLEASRLESREEGTVSYTQTLAVKYETHEERRSYSTHSNETLKNTNIDYEDSSSQVKIRNTNSTVILDLVSDGFT